MSVRGAGSDREEASDGNYVDGTCSEGVSHLLSIPYVIFL